MTLAKKDKINSYFQKVGPTLKCDPYYAIKGHRK